jgi:hypothetical protein
MTFFPIFKPLLVVIILLLDYEVYEQMVWTKAGAGELNVA